MNRKLETLKPANIEERLNDMIEYIQNMDREFINGMVVDTADGTALAMVLGFIKTNRKQFEDFCADTKRSYIEDTMN